MITWPGAPSFAFFAKGGTHYCPCARRCSVPGLRAVPECGRSRVVASHPSLERSEGWGTLTLLAVQGWATRRHQCKLTGPAGPAHRDGAAMNWAQLPLVHDDSSGLMTGPPALEPRMVGVCGLPPIPRLQNAAPSTALRNGMDGAPQSSGVQRMGGWPRSRIRSH